MRTISEQELKTILDKHGKWLRNEEGGEWKLSSYLQFNYWVSSDGKIASAITPALTLRKLPRILKLRKSSNGYLSIRFKGKNKLVHRIVAEAFIGKTEGKSVHHTNAIRVDNRVGNLEIVSLSKNNSEGHKTRKQAYGGFIKLCAEMIN
jgi:hypothetical protein